MKECFTQGKLANEIKFDACTHEDYHVFLSFTSNMEFKNKYSQQGCFKGAL